MECASQVSLPIGREQKPNFTERPLCQSIKPRHFKAVIFDFDSTLTSVPEVPRTRLLPGLSSRATNLRWLHEVGFGGEHRLDLLLRTLHELRDRWGAELSILSLASREVVVRALEQVGALRFFGGECAQELRVFGHREIVEAGGDQPSKGNLLRALLQSRGWRYEDVLFVDDLKSNVESASPVCRVFWVRGGAGLSETELLSLHDTGGASLDLVPWNSLGQATSTETEIALVAGVKRKADHGDDDFVTAKVPRPSSNLMNVPRPHLSVVPRSSVVGRVARPVAALPRFRSRHNAPPGGVASASSRFACSGELCKMYNNRRGCKFGSECAFEHCCDRIVLDGGHPRACGKNHPSHEHPE